MKKAHKNSSENRSLDVTTHKYLDSKSKMHRSSRNASTQRASLNILVYAVLHFLDSIYCFDNKDRAMMNKYMIIVPNIFV